MTLITLKLCIMTFNTLKTLGLLACSTLLFCCKKDKTEVKESPFFDFFQDSAISIDTVGQSADSWEYGFVFTPLKSGRITEFGIKLPAEGMFRVTLWDLSGAAPSLLRSQEVNSPQLHTEAQASIPEVALQSGRKYGITVLSDAFYRISKAGNATFDFPRTVGNIQIESFNEGINDQGAATFPTTTNDTRVAPCVNVIFIAD